MSDSPSKDPTARHLKDLQFDGGASSNYWSISSTGGPSQRISRTQQQKHSGSVNTNHSIDNATDAVEVSSTCQTHQFSITPGISNQVTLSPSKVLSPLKTPPIFTLDSSTRSSSGMTTPRNRAPRSGNRGGGSGPEEYAIWEQCKDDFSGFIAIQSEAATRSQEYNEMQEDFERREKEGVNVPNSEELGNLVNILRELQALDNQALGALSGGGYPLKERIQVLKAIQGEKETFTAEPLRRGGSSRDGNRADGTSNSPAPSSSVDKEKSTNLKRIHRDRENRGSMPPKDTTTNQEGSSAPSVASNDGVMRNSKGKIVYSKGDEVAFKNADSEWIQGKVVQVSGEGKSRRYQVLDIEPDPSGGQSRPFKTSASSMIPIPPIDSVLTDYEPKTRVLAMYPDTTGFYDATVVEGKGPMITLRFDGEDEENKMSMVERRFVLEPHARNQ